MTFKELDKNILTWAKNRDLLHYENRFKQLNKVVEEVQETSHAIHFESIENQELEIGDIGVSVIVLCNQLGFDFETCIEKAYNKIKDRKGKTVNGTFVKE